MKSKWYAIRAKARSAPEARATAEVLIYGDIGESWWAESVSASDFVRELGAVDADEITVRINSLGGSVPDGIAIHNAIQRHPAHVTTVVDAMAASIASLIACAGDSVEMAENATLMVHAPWTYMAGNAGDLRDAADVLDTWARAMATSYAAKTGMSHDECMALLSDGRDHWYTAAEAKAAGFCDEIGAALPVAASAGIDLSRFRGVPAALAARFPAAPAAQPPEPAMPQVNPTPQAAATPTGPAPVDEAAVRAAALAADNARREAIRAAFARWPGTEGAPALQAQCENDHACTPEAASKRLLELIGSQCEPIAGHHVTTTEDETDKRRSGIVAALMARANVADDKTRASVQGSPFRGLRLLDIARASLERTGFDVRGKSQMEIVAAAFTQSGSDFPVLLENTMHKTLQGAYATAAFTWKRFCAEGSVSDFRVHNRYRVGSLGNMAAVNELGEFTNKTIPDGEKATIQAGTKGFVINLSRQAVINDDLGAFVGLSAQMGRAAARTVEADVYALLVSNPTMQDGVALFHASHGNLAGTGAAPSVTALEAIRVAMASQMDVSGNDYLDLRPDVVLAPLSLGGTLRVINDAQYDPDTANKLQRPNQVRGLFRDVVDTPRLSGTAYYTFASPSEAPVLEVAFLDGNSTPYLETHDGFHVDGASMKVRLDYGVAAVDYRGAYKQPGA